MDTQRIQHFETEWGDRESYSQAVRANGLIVTAGQLGAEPGGDVVPFEQQATTALRRLIEAVETAGGTAASIMKVTGYLASMDHFADYDRVYRQVFGARPRPARTTIAVNSFIAPVLVEVEALAAL